MKMKKLISALSFIITALAASPLHAQIGYQVSLLNTATGEPQANKTVNVNISITNAENEIVYTEIQTATTNDFGILSLSVGKEDTFKDADWNKLPFYIAATVNGTLIGKSQILTVPVAEYAKTAGTVLTKEMLVGKWGYNATYTTHEGVPYDVYCYIIFNEDGTGFCTDGEYSYSIFWEIINSHIYLYRPTSDDYIYSTEPLALLAIYTFNSKKNKLIAHQNLGMSYSNILSKEQIQP